MHAWRAWTFRNSTRPIVDAGFITWVDVSSRPGDTLTLRPMLEEMEEYLHFKYRDIVADAVATVYRCGDCSGCPHKDKCIRGNNCRTPMEERTKVLYVSRTKE